MLFNHLFKYISGKASLDKADLEPALKALKDKLMTKNVTAVEEALVRILTPEQSIDILRDVHAAKERKEYVVGVNGVGKSTNLAKVAYWLQQHKVIVMMAAACDTFRSGAHMLVGSANHVLHALIYDTHDHLFYYNKDPATVAKEAIMEAGRNGSDVDTAGRIHIEHDKMSALAKLIYDINPDLSSLVAMMQLISYRNLIHIMMYGYHDCEDSSQVIIHCCLHLFCFLLDLVLSLNNLCST
ncbi:G-protein [Lithospermum erythrorhizon]|uniref:G-protein n=1 Tax=Lithospermum erythrorhizon TaxID=34254 RepID=A0AAV3NUY9_LITER